MCNRDMRVALCCLLTHSLVFLTWDDDPVQIQPIASTVCISLEGSLFPHAVISPSCDQSLACLQAMNLQPRVLEKRPTRCTVYDMDLPALCTTKNVHIDRSSLKKGMRKNQSKHSGWFGWKMLVLKCLQTFTVSCWVPNGQSAFSITSMWAEAA